MNKPFCYIAGPYRSNTINGIAENIARARAVAARCWSLGFTTFCPHINSAFMDGVVSDEKFLSGDLEILTTLAMSSRGCVIVLVDEWERSNGTKKEIEHAKDMGVRVFNSFNDFHNWAADEFVNETIEILS